VAAADLAPPHGERLVRRLRALEEPLIQVWGWPGTGRAALLEALLAAEGERALGLSLGELSGERELRAALDAARAHRVRFLVAGSCSAEQATLAAQWLTPGQHLVFASERRATALPGVVLPPQELLLEAREVADLWHLLTGTLPDPRAAEGLRAASDGWYLPLRLALEATGGAGLASFDTGVSGVGEDLLLEVPAVRSFLRHQVLAAFSEEEREMLLAADPEPEAWMSGRGLSAGWRAMIESRGLWVERVDGEGPPRLLAAYLARQRQRHLERVERVERTERPPKRPPRLEAGEPARPVSEGAGPVYRLTLLGDPSVRQVDAEGTEHQLDWRLRRSFQVLAFLASSPGLQAGREELIEAVWPREGEQTIDRNFHPTLSHLRRSLERDRRGGPPPLLFRAGVYRLNPEITWEIDLLEFRRLVEEGRATAERGGANAPGGDANAAVGSWKRAWKLYRGPFLQGYYDAWVSSRREEYHRTYLELLRELGDLYLRLGCPDEAMDAFRSVLVEDPLQERVHIAVMRLYAAQGRRDLLRKQYDRLCTLLLEELGVEPLPETTQEYHRLISGGG
jgi:DNA-binding SARP family transcriptional activator